MIVLIHNDMELWDFMTEGLKSRNDFYDVPLQRYCSLINRLLRKCFVNRHLPARFVFGHRLINLLKGLKLGDKVVVSDYTDLCIYYAIKDLISPGVCVSLWLWNPIMSNRQIIADLDSLKSLGVNCNTFDLEDARLLNLNHLSTFYNMNIENSMEDDFNIKYDFYFLGVAKDRGDVISEMQRRLSSYKNLFIIPSQPSQYITYFDNIQNINSSRCIVDVVQHHQHDITLRPLEAIAYRRKLITNNIHIKECSFYDPNNIFIWGVDKIENLETFLNAPYEDVEKDVIEKFDINYWLDRV